MHETEKLSFRISSGLKNIIGRELISNKYIAVFELVKNSYDAGAENVTITYKANDDDSHSLIIEDDGVGMDYDSLVNRWLFVAYSEKKERNREETYIDDMKRTYAGAKGIGRFSCDRLGSKLSLTTKCKQERSTHVIDVNWDDFERNDKDIFEDVSVNYQSVLGRLPENGSGTKLSISGLRETWSRVDLLALKRSLMKLVNPDMDKGTKLFSIKIIAPEEEYEDEKVRSNPDRNEWRDTVNGFIRNDVFEKMNLKTTCIDVSVSEDGMYVQTKMHDRGQYLFSLKTKNRKYECLKNIHIVVYYLNSVAKSAFTKQMGGVRPKDYGSIFVYKNGFRVNPYGESGQDFFGIDQRKAQGWRRHLGTREVMGRVSILSDDDSFVETSSRAHGFIQTKAVDELENFFIKEVLSVLEKYVVGLIAWGEPGKDSDQAISPEEINDKIISQFITNVDEKDIVAIDYSEALLKNRRGNVAEADASIKALEELAAKINDKNLSRLVSRTKQISEENEKLTKENEEKAKELEKVKKENETREKQVFFLQNAADQNVNNLLDGLHLIYSLSDANVGNINYCLKLGRRNNFAPEILNTFLDAYKINLRIKKMADMAFRGNADMRRNVLGNVFDFITQYVTTLRESQIEIRLEGKCKKNCRFSPSGMGVIIDNIISNSKKNSAKHLEIIVSQTDKKTLISFCDDGLGLDPLLDSQKIFERGYTSNKGKRGFGFGLSCIKEFFEDMGGKVAYDEQNKKGFKLDAELENE